MKKLLYFAFALVAATGFFACNDDDDDNPTGRDYLVYLEQSQVDFSNLEGSRKIGIRTNAAWDATVVNAENANWITIVSEGTEEAGEGSVTISVLPNETETYRAATINVKAGTAVEAITVVQNAANNYYVTFDGFGNGSYYADYTLQEAAATFRLRSGTFNDYDVPVGLGYVFDLTCFVDFADNPWNASLTPGEYTEGNELDYAERKYLINSELYGNTVLYIYDEQGRKKEFTIAEGSSFVVTKLNDYTNISGTLIDGKGGSFTFQYRGETSFTNEYKTSADKDGYTIIQNDGGLRLAWYQGHADLTTNSQLVYLDLRDDRSDSNNSLIVSFYIPAIDEFYIGSREQIIAPGVYSFANTETEPFSIKKGKFHVENTGMGTVTTGMYSSAYTFDGSARYYNMIVTGGEIDVKVLDTKTYDVTFDLTGENILGEAGDIYKFRYIGPLNLEDRKPEMITTLGLKYTELFYLGASVGNPSIHKYSFRFSENADRGAKVSKHLMAEFYGPAPANMAKLRFPDGTYTPKDDESMWSIYPQYGSSWNPKGSYIFTVDAIGLSRGYLLQEGSYFTVSTIDAGLPSEKVRIEIKWKGYESSKDAMCVADLIFEDWGNAFNLVDKS